MACSGTALLLVLMTTMKYKYLCRRSRVTTRVFKFLMSYACLQLEFSRRAEWGNLLSCIYRRLLHSAVCYKQPACYRNVRTQICHNRMFIYSSVPIVTSFCIISCIMQPLTLLSCLSCNPVTRIQSLRIIVPNKDPVLFWLQPQTVT
jgi:hypothetical protein